MNKREKVYLIIIVLLLGALMLKSFYFDEYNPVTKDEKLFKEYVETLASKKYDGFLVNNKLISFKVVSIKKLENKGVSIIKVKNGNDNDYKKVEIQGKYKAKIRKYLLHILPYWEDKVLSKK